MKVSGYFRSGKTIGAENVLFTTRQGSSGTSENFIFKSITDVQDAALKFAASEKNYSTLILLPRTILPKFHQQKVVLRS